MIMYNKGQNYAILKDIFKVPVNNLTILKDLGVILKVGDTALSLDNCKGLSKEHSFNTLINNAVKNPSTEHIVQINAFVGNFINLAKQSYSSSLASEPKKPKVTQVDLDSMPIVQLRDATMLYQRVNGTSGGSIYRVIALGDKIKVAARIKGNAVSLRVEGTFDSTVVNSFNSLGVLKKTDEYLSGHFNCENCTPQKLIGSILVGASVPFNTPIPVITSKVFN